MPRHCRPIGFLRHDKMASFVVVLMTLVAAVSTEELYQADCRNPLGMHSGEIKDEWIRASSSYDEASVGPQSGRIRTERNGGAWCPKSQIDRTVYEWLEVDLNELKVVTLVETQGRFGNGQGQEYAENYVLEYQRIEGSNWIKFRNRTGGMVFQGNMNTYTTVLREINPPIIARKIRIVPYSSHPRTVCMRVELYGCTWKDGIISYSMPQGERRGSEVDLYDFIYDGKVEDKYLSGGLGQLTDRDKGETNFRLDPMGIGKRGYQWIGWKNDTDDRPPVEIVFEFDKVRNFTNAVFYSNNMFSKDVRVFRMAKLYFSVGGKYYQKEPVLFLYMRDTVMEYARNVLIPIPNRIGRFIKVQLYFDARWLMLSEVQFGSTIATGNYTEEPPPGEDTDTFRVGNHRDVFLTDGDVTGVGSVSGDGVGESDGTQRLDDQYIGIIIGALGALILLIGAIVIFVVVRRRKQKYSSGSQLKPVQTQHVTLNLDDLRALTNSNGKVVSNGNVYNSIATSEIDSEQDGLARGYENGKVAPNGDAYQEPFDGIQTRRLPELPLLKTPESGTDTMTSREYAVPDLSKVPNGGPPMATFSYRADTPPPPPLPPHPQALYGGMDTTGLQGFSGNSMYAVPNSLDLLWKDDLAVLEFPRDSLHFIEKLGEGQFGEVHLCESFGIAEILGEDFLINRTGGTVPSMLVAVKTLRQNADDQARADFHKEVKIMSRLKDPNIVRVLGVCTQDEPLCMIVEYMKYGDLHQFLQQHVPLESSIARKKSARALSYGCLIYMATQIASGMKYLETLNMVHRDLATRNCLVGHLYTIKISDFGMSRSLYSRDYYRIEGKAVLPIRWMAWESLLLGKFSTKSDVWSFACTVWEVLTFAREQPYNNLTDEQVIENCGHFYRNDGNVVYLPRPANCPKEIYDLLVECWNREEFSRPAFREIHMFLQRKNMGYDPRDERHSTPTRLTLPVV